MIRRLTLLSFFGATLVQGQVQLDAPVELTGSDGERQVIDLGLPTNETAAITVEVTLLGVANWAEATAVANAITLIPTVPVTAYRDGQLLRFIAPSSIHSEVTLACEGSPAFAVVRPDGIWPARGQIWAGTVCEVLFAGDHWVLLNAPERGCPPGTVALNEHLCVEVTGQENMLFYPASDRCMRMGGRLCKWGEFHAACVDLGTQLTGMTTAWEWIDDSQNHAHTGVNVGLNSCTAQKWALPNTTSLARSRCCFEPR